MCDDVNARFEVLRPAPAVELDGAAKRTDDLRRAERYGLCPTCGEPRQVQIIRPAVAERPEVEFISNPGGRGEGLSLYCPICDVRPRPAVT